MNLQNLFLKFFFISMAIILLSGCGQTDTCLEPDDFGFAKVAVSSRYKEQEIFGDKTNEITPWIDYELILDGQPLYISVKNWIPGEDANEPGILSAWCPWFGEKGQNRTLSTFCERLPICNFRGAENCYDSKGDPTSNSCVIQALCTNQKNADITNAPCLMTKGLGLYALLTRPGINPNLTLGTMMSPEGLSFHLGDPHVGYMIPSMSNSGKMTNTGGLMYNYDGSRRLNSSRLGYINGKLHLKILDTFYEDNNGQYRVFIKSGIFNGGSDPISWCIELVKTALFGSHDDNNYNTGIIPQIYQSVVSNSGFVNAVRATLILYVMFSAIGFLIGSIEVSQRELISRIIKIIVIVTLISPSSWTFFNQHIFIWFYEGTNFIIKILYDVAAAGPGSSNPLNFFFSEEIFIKLSSLLFSTPTGWIYIIIYLIMLIFLVIIYFDAAVLYMTALIMMGLLISLSPVFITLYLFNQTKSFFDNWLKQLFGYAIQIILVFAGILFMTMIIRNQIYNTLGFPVCSIEFPNLGGITIFKWYFPKITGWGANPQQAVIPIPKDHFQSVQDSAIAANFTQQNLADGDFCLNNPALCNDTSTNTSTRFCSAYECIGSRYPDLPFLDPNDPYEAKLIRQIRNGYIGDFGGLAILIICVYLMDHFNKTTVSMAKFLSNNVGNRGSNAGAARMASLNMRSAATNYVDNKLGISRTAQLLRAGVHNFLAQAKDKMIDKPWADYKIGKLREEALNASSSKTGSKSHNIFDNSLKSVVRGAEAKSGVSQFDALELKRNLSNGDYIQNLTTSLQESVNMNNTGTAQGMSLGAKNIANLSPEISKQILNRIIKEPRANVKDILANEIFMSQDGKSAAKYKSAGTNAQYQSLSSEQKAVIDQIETNPEFKKIMDLKLRQDKFQDAYVDSYIQMSDEGRGFLQKRSALLRWGNDVKAEFKASAQASREAELMNAETFLSKYDNMKRLVSGGLLGSERSQIMYNDSNMRTMDEELSDKLFAKERIELSKTINKKIVEESTDIQSAAFISQMSNDSKKAEYLALIDANLTATTKESLRYKDKDKTKALLMGDTYMKTKMTDKDMREMIDNLKYKAEDLMKNDEYIKDREMYQNDDLATEYLSHRAQVILDTVNSEIDRINDIRSARGMSVYYGIQNASIDDLFSQGVQKQYGIDNELFAENDQPESTPDPSDKYRMPEDKGNKKMSNKSTSAKKPPTNRT